jgi:hypothetical protein
MGLFMVAAIFSACSSTCDRGTASDEAVSAYKPARGEVRSNF